MPVHLSKRGGTVLGPGGKVEKRFSSRTKARRYATAVNLAYARKKGYKVPPAPKRRSKRRRR